MTASSSAANVRFGVDMYSLGAQRWTPFQQMEWAAKWKLQMIHFSEIRFLGSPDWNVALDPANLRSIRERADALHLDVEIGMRSICPTASAFEAAAGTAQEQLGRMIDAAKIIKSPIVRCVLGTQADRRGPIEKHIDSGNAVWTIEDPHLTLETLAPYVLTSHVRDSYVFNSSQGTAVQWCRMGEGNVGMEDYLRKYVELCPGKAVSLEVIVVNSPRMFNYRDPQAWEIFRTTPAWEFARFLALCDRGTPRPLPPPAPAGQRGGGGSQGQPSPEALSRNLEDVEASVGWTQSFLSSRP
jgi:hypothetical protein